MKPLRQFIEKFREKHGLELCLATDIIGKLQFISTGSLLLDAAMGGGFPQPRITQVYGAPSTGKSLLTLKAMANVTQAGGYAIHCDLENSYNTEELNQWRTTMGIVGERVVHIQAQPAADVINTVLHLLKNYPDEMQLVVIDSVSALTTEKLLEKNTEDGYVDETPKMMNLFCKKLLQFNKRAAILAVSHIMSDIGSYTKGYVPKGGLALQHFSAMRLEVKGAPIYTTSTDVDGAKTHRIDVLVKKNKVGTPGRSVKNLVFDFASGGFDKQEELLTVALQWGILQQKGSYLVFAHDTDLKFHGRDAFKEFLFEKPEYAEWIWQCVSQKEPINDNREHYGTGSIQ